MKGGGGEQKKEFRWPERKVWKVLTGLAVDGLCFDRMALGAECNTIIQFMEQWHRIIALKRKLGVRKKGKEWVTKIKSEHNKENI